MAIKNSWSSGEVLTAADLTDTMKGVFINAQTGTTYTFATADSFVSLSNASGGTATIPANATAAFNTGAVIGVMNAGTAGSFTIGTAAGVTLNAVSGTTTLAPLESASLVKLGTNTWQLSKGGGLPKATYSATTGSPTVTTVSGKTVIKWTGDGSVTLTKGVVRVVAVGGGGGGGKGRNTGTNDGAGGGGGGGMLDVDVYVPSDGTYNIAIGAGGTCGTYSSTAGGATSLGSLLIIPGGGFGAHRDSNTPSSPGGSGGGGSMGYSSASQIGPSGVLGYAGASGNNNGGGGGGAGGAGSGSTGGVGRATTVSGASETFAAGGNGNAALSSGGNNTGNGGSGGSQNVNGGTGGSGLLYLVIG